MSSFRISIYDNSNENLRDAGDAVGDNIGDNIGDGGWDTHGVRAKGAAGGSHGFADVLKGVAPPNQSITGTADGSANAGCNVT